MTKIEPDGRFFAWVVVPSLMGSMLHPQIIHDAEVAKYQTNLVNTQARLVIAARQVLRLDEYDLTVDQLAKKYPAPHEAKTD